jgi:hypothetical protein
MAKNNSLLRGSGPVAKSKDLVVTNAPLFGLLKNPNSGSLRLAISRGRWVDTASL